MSARLLKVVNSAYFGLAKPVADVARAGALLGLDRLMALVLGQGLFSGGDAPRVPGFSLEALWTHSLATATAAHRIAIDEGLDKEQVAAAFLAGMALGFFFTDVEQPDARTGDAEYVARHD